MINIGIIMCIMCIMIHRYSSSNSFDSNWDRSFLLLNSFPLRYRNDQHSILWQVRHHLLCPCSSRQIILPGELSGCHHLASTPSCDKLDTTSSALAPAGRSYFLENCLAAITWPASDFSSCFPSTQITPWPAETFSSSGL